MSNHSDITVAILAGGLGKRLRSKVSGRPKVLAEVTNHPFLEYLLNQINNAGFKKVVICTGYLGHQVQKQFGNRYKNLSLSYSEEELQLGTAGAVRYALPYLKSRYIMVMNGDSYVDADLKKFWQFYKEKRADAVILLTEVLDTSRYGRVEIGKLDEILEFQEKKENTGKGFINAGIYLLKRELIKQIPKGRVVSLEKEIFPYWIRKRFFGFRNKGKFIDIGTPQSYYQAENFFKESTSKRFVLLDRDGTLVVHRPYLSHPDQIELIPGAVEALKEFKKMGLGVVVITNQSGVGRGYFNLKTLEKIHKTLTDLLSKEGIFLDDIYFCPHTPEDDCLCRKPKVELIEKAAKKHHFNPKLCFVIGDNKSDMELGKNIGATTILVRTGYGIDVEKGNHHPDFVVDSLKEAIPVIKDYLKG